MTPAERAAIECCHILSIQPSSTNRGALAAIIEREFGPAVELMENLLYYLTLRDPEDEPEYESNIAKARAFLEQQTKA